MHRRHPIRVKEEGEWERRVPRIVGWCSTGGILHTEGVAADAPTPPHPCEGGRGMGAQGRQMHRRHPIRVKEEGEWERRGTRSHTPILNQFFGLAAL